MPLSRSTAGDEPLRPVITTMLPLPPRSFAIFSATPSAHRHVALPDEQRLVGRHVAIHDDQREASRHHCACGRNERGRFNGAHENRVDAAREKIAHVIVLLGDVDIAVDDDEFDVRMAAGLRLKGGQHRDAPGMIEARLRKPDRDVSGLSGDGDRPVGQGQDRRERQVL